ncbi:MAG: DNA adenine methylase [Candidatus Nomurabacteria bacterium]|jgi:adenine-specific DNA-methyltransferase|nr:DNA adenine methylase [Candidatus Nomurabacteria bacterium]
MNYIGSKLSLLDFLDRSIEEVAGKDKSLIFCDLFAGTGAVGTHFKKKGHKVIANDLQYYSYVLNRHFVGNHKPLKFEGLIVLVSGLKSADIAERKNIVCEYLQNLDGVKGFVYQNYCPNDSGDEQRLYFTAENGKKCDAIREKIEEWRNKKLINDDEYFYLLATLLEAIDKSANTASVYGAFLKSIKKSAGKPMALSPLPLYLNDNEHEIYNEDVNDVIKKISPDIIYLDPPYNTRQYSANYHILETIAKNDRPKIKGKTGLRDWSGQKSVYCSRAKVKQAFADLIKNAKARYIFLSYNNEGLMSLNDIKEIMSSRGKYGYFTQDYSRFKADNNRDYSANKTTEYLHYVVVNN